MVIIFLLEHFYFRYFYTTCKIILITINKFLICSKNSLTLVTIKWPSNGPATWQHHSRPQHPRSCQLVRQFPHQTRCRCARPPSYSLSSSRATGSHPSLKYPNDIDLLCKYHVDTRLFIHSSFYSSCYTSLFRVAKSFMPCPVKLY